MGTASELKVIDRVMWDLKQGDLFRYGGSNIEWEVLSVDNSDNKEMSVTIKSKKAKKTVKLYPYYNQKGNFLAHYGDRWVEVFVN